MSLLIVNHYAKRFIGEKMAGSASGNFTLQNGSQVFGNRLLL